MNFTKPGTYVKGYINYYTCIQIERFFYYICIQFDSSTINNGLRNVTKVQITN